MIVLGSTALQRHLPLYSIKPADLDLLGDFDEYETFRKQFKPSTFFPIASGKKMYMRKPAGTIGAELIVEVDICWEGSVAAKLRDFIMAEPDTWDNRDTHYPSLDVLYMLKMSHRYLRNSPHFLKTMRHIQLMREHGAVIRKEHEAFYQDRMKDTYTYSHPKLNVKKDSFFDQEATGMVYTYDHDSIHEAIKIGSKPAYQYFKEDESEVLTNKELFNSAPEHVKLAAGMEEAMVLAIERSLRHGIDESLYKHH
jgi:hypothetical protein